MSINMQTLSLPVNVYMVLQSNWVGLKGPVYSRSLPQNCLSDSFKNNLPQYLPSVG